MIVRQLGKNRIVLVFSVLIVVDSTNAKWLVFHKLSMVQSLTNFGPEQGLIRFNKASLLTAKGGPVER